MVKIYEIRCWKDFGTFKFTWKYLKFAEFIEKIQIQIFEMR